MFADERMLGVAARWEGYALDVVVAHAPCNVRHSASDPDSENRAWWKKLAREIRKAHNPEVGLVWMIDANGKVGSYECSAIGCTAAWKENDNGLMLREAPDGARNVSACNFRSLCWRRANSGPGHPLLVRFIGWTTLH